MNPIQRAGQIAQGLSGMATSAVRTLVGLVNVGFSQLSGNERLGNGGTANVLYGLDGIAANARLMAGVPATGDRDAPTAPSYQSFAREHDTPASLALPDASPRASSGPTPAPAPPVQSLPAAPAPAPRRLAPTPG